MAGTAKKNRGFSFFHQFGAKHSEKLFASLHFIEFDHSKVACLPYILVRIGFYPEFIVFLASFTLLFPLALPILLRLSLFFLI